MGNIATPAPWYEADQAARKLPQALFWGVEAMREGARDGGQGKRASWMYPHRGEYRQAKNLGMTLYDLRVETSELRNIWLDGIDELVAAPFAQDFTLSDEWSDQIQEWRENVDGSGQRLEDFMREISRWSWGMGVDLMMVEYPDMGGKPPQPGQTQQPYWVPIRSSEVIDAIVEFSEGRIRLLETRIKRRAQSRTGNVTEGYGWKDQEEVHLYRAADGEKSYARKLRYLKSGDNSWAEDTKGWRPLIGQNEAFKDIPLVPIYTNRLAPFRGRPYFLDAAGEQARHFRKMSEMDRNGSITAIPQLFQSGYKPLEKDQKAAAPDDLYAMLYSPDAGATAHLVETNGKALEFLADDLERTERAIGSAMLRPRIERATGNVTATEIGLVGLRARSQQEMQVRMLCASVRRALEFVEMFKGLPPSGGTVSMPFQTRISEADFQAYKELYIEGVMSPTGFWKVAEAAGKRPESLEVDEEVRWAENQTRTGALP